MANNQSMKLYKEEDVLRMLRSFHNLEMNVQLCMLKLKPVDLEEMLYKTFCAGQESMEEGGKGFEQYYNEIFNK